MMKATISLSVLLLLAVTRQSSATTAPADLLCVYGGKSYKNADIIPHENGCTELQCQFGMVVAYYEACGKEIDGQCHTVGSSFQFEKITYECQSTTVDTVPIYRNVRLTPVYQGCEAEGKQYQHLEQFRLSDECRLYQCQDGNVEVIEPACGKELDGNCYALDQWFMYNNLFYICAKAEENGQTVYKHKEQSPQPNPNVFCLINGNKLANLEIMTTSNGCNKRQCQSGKLPTYIQKCKFFKDEGKCYAEGEQWVFQDKLYECQRTEIDGQVSLSAKTEEPSYLSCWFAEDLYQHLDVLHAENGCTLRQCVNGQTPFLKRACVHLDVCRTVNSLWIIEGVTYKCIVTSYDYTKVVRVDEFGNYDEGQKPQVPEIGELPEFEGCPAVADIIMIFDSSRSMSEETFKLEIEFGVNITRYFDIGPDDVRIGAIVFSDDAQKVCDLKDHSDHESLEAALRAMPFMRQKTATQKALNLIIDDDMFGTASGGRDEAENIVIIMTDGDSDNTDITLAAADRVKALDIKIMTVGVGLIHMDELVGMASRYEDAFRAPSFDLLATLLGAVSRRACDSVDKCKDDPCEHFCYGTDDGFECACQEGYEVDPNDETKCVDVDECAGASSPCQQVCNNKEGGFQCSCREGYIISQLDKTKCVDVDECTSGGESPCEQVCTNEPGSYQCSCNEGYDVSADPSQCDDVDECLNNPCQHECTNTDGSFECTCNDGFAVSEADPTKCTDIDECEQSPCEQVCINLAGSYKCSCEDGYVVNPDDHTKCDEIVMCKTKADIIILYDASSSIGAEHFNKQFDFAKRLFRHFTIGPDDVRFGGIVFSLVVKGLFNLSDHDDYSSLDQAVSNVAYMNSSTYTDLALQWITWYSLFSSANGGRDDAKDIVILITDGNANRQSKTVTASLALQSKGVTIMAIAIGDEITLEKLEEVVSSPDNIVYATNYDQLDYIEQRVADLACGDQ